MTAARISFRRFAVHQQLFSELGVEKVTFMGKNWAQPSQDGQSDLLREKKSFLGANLTAHPGWAGPSFWERQSAACNIRVTVLHAGSTCNTVTRVLHVTLM